MEILCGHFAQYSRHIAFPEMCYHPLNYLKSFRDKIVYQR